MEYINKQLWLDMKLSEECMKYLNECIAQSHSTNAENMNKNLAGNIHESLKLKDKDNWFYETALRKITERQFYKDWDNQYKYRVIKEAPEPKFYLNNMWVNYQKQGEFNPLHSHTGLYSFVIFMKIPTDWEEQHGISFSQHSNSPFASDFQFVFPEEATGKSKIWSEEVGRKLIKINHPLSPKDEGKMLFFPSWLHHQVFPFYNCDEDRITISGNIVQERPDAPEDPLEPFISEKKSVLEQKREALRMSEMNLLAVTEVIHNLQKEINQIVEEQRISTTEEPKELLLNL